MHKPVYFIVLLLFFAAIPSNVRAWVRHNLITKYAIREISWLDEYNQITVTPYTYQDNSLNPDYKITYTNPDPAQVNPPAHKFVYYNLDTKKRPGYKGAAVGEITSARQILTDYSDEPDWDMDKRLSLSFAQRLMAGSHGYRHMYYPAWDWHLPYLFIAQGAAPDRARHFYDMAQKALAKDDMYWYFRFLARIIHYIEDMGQPYHSAQTGLRFITPLNPLAGTTQSTKNYHFTYESYVNYRLQQEDVQLSAPNYILAIKNAGYIKCNSVPKLLRDIVEKNNKRTSSVFKICVDFFGDKLRSKDEVKLDQNSVDDLKNSANVTRFDDMVYKSLQITSAGVRGFLDYVKNTAFQP